MKQEQRSQAFLRKRKMLLIFPLLVIPFLTMAFWAMGGGKTNGDSKLSEKTEGLNLNLPDANLKDNKGEDKLSFYDKADKDSLKLEEWMRSDPYYKQKAGESPSEVMESVAAQTASRYRQHLNTFPYNNQGQKPEDAVMQKLAVLQEQLNKPDTKLAGTKKANDAYRSQVNGDFSNEVDRLETSMKQMNQPESGDPDMQRMDSMLDKILDIQHPERLKNRIRDESVQHKRMVFAVQKSNNNASVSLLDTLRAVETTNRFYELENNEVAVDQNAIEAVVDENQVLVSGAIVKLRLVNDIYVEGSLIPRDNFVFGVASLNRERLEIGINSIRYLNSLFPVKLQVYDADGLPGIHIPGAIARDVAKQSADNSLQLMEWSSMDPSLKAQAASAGLSAAKNLLSNKVKLVKVTVKPGYRVLLVNTESKQ
jgi:conjugative transposon TraM protein